MRAACRRCNLFIAPNSSLFCREPLEADHLPEGLWHVDGARHELARADGAAILKLHCAGKPQDRIDFAAVAKATTDYSGADLKAVVDRAVEGKLKEAMRTGVPKPLTTTDLAPGKKIKAIGAPRRDNPTEFFLKAVILPDGQKFSVIN